MENTRNIELKHDVVDDLFEVNNKLNSDEEDEEIDEEES